MPTPPPARLGEFQHCCLCADVSESVSVGGIMGTGWQGTPGWWRDAKWNRRAETVRCQKGLIIRISFPKQTYCNQITYCIRCCIVLCVCVYCISDNDLDQLSWKRLDQFPRHYSRAVAAHIYFFNFFLALSFCSWSYNHNCCSELLITMDRLK